MTEMNKKDYKPGYIFKCQIRYMREKMQAFQVNFSKLFGFSFQSNYVATENVFNFYKSTTYPQN